MNAEARQWLEYARENLEMARIGLERELFNASLQNAQQAVEKALKAVLITSGRDFPRTHSIRELARQVREAGGQVVLSEEDSDLLDAIYIPSKYPVFGVLPDGIASAEICQRCLLVAERVLSDKQLAGI